MGKVMRHTLGASLNIRHNLSSSKGPKPLQLKLLTTYIPKDRKSGSAGMPRPISYAVFCLKKKTLMVGHTFLYSAPIQKIKEIVGWGDIGDIRYISTRRLNLGLFQQDMNVAWDLAPHDISIILHIMGETPISVNSRGSAHVTQGIEDVTSMSLHFSKNRSAIIHSSW